jgi:hypothetical protein
MGMNDVHKLETKLNAGVLTFHCSFIKWNKISMDLNQWKFLEFKTDCKII